MNTENYVWYGSISIWRKIWTIWNRSKPKGNSFYNFAFRSPIPNFVKIRPGTFGDTTYEHVETTSPLWVHFMCFMLRTTYQACLFNYAVDWVQHQPLMPRMPVNLFSLHALIFFLLSTYGFKHVAFILSIWWLFTLMHAYKLQFLVLRQLPVYMQCKRKTCYTVLRAIRRSGACEREHFHSASGWNVRQSLQFLRQAFHGSITYQPPCSLRNRRGWR